MGALYANTQLTDSTFTIEAKLRVSGAFSTENQGVALWLSEFDPKDFPFGSFFGAGSTFKGVVVYLNSSSKTVGGIVADRTFDLTHETVNARENASCQIDPMNKDIRILVKAANKVLKVSVAEEEGAFQQCFEVNAM